MQWELGAGRMLAFSSAGRRVVVGLGATQSAFCFKRVRSGTRRVPPSLRDEHLQHQILRDTREKPSRILVPFESA
jgi:hypothetical protein